jgi:hypothetical protein
MKQKKSGHVQVVSSWAGRFSNFSFFASYNPTKHALEVRRGKNGGLWVERVKGGGRRKEEGGGRRRRKEEGGRRKEEGGRRKEEGGGGIKS